MAAARPTILLTGAAGQLGRELAAILPSIGELVACDRTALDLGDAASIARVVRATRPQVIVNAAAYTAVDRAESEREQAFAINGTAPGVLAIEAKRLSALLIHYSTDYVFSGDADAPYDETSTTGPLNVYGASKLEGERGVAASGAAALVLRTSWVYSRHGQNFLVTMQKLAAERDEIRVVADQTGVPNWSRALARATATLIGRGVDQIAERAGLYHLCAQGHATWYEFARAIIGESSRTHVVPITTADYPTPARRPRYAVLDATRFTRAFGFALPHWQTLLQACLGEPAEPAVPRQVH